MLVHVVLFNLKSDMTDEQVAAFERDLMAMSKIEHACSFHVGKVAGTEKRPVVQTDWDYMLTVVVDDVAAHDAYQAHPIHKEFVKNQQPFFERVRVFDGE